MRAFRSLMFVPGHKPTWVDKAVAAGTDAIILDLEDSVPADLKHAGRADVAASIDRLYAQDAEVGILVRPNALDTEHFGADLEAVVRPGLEALLVPKPGDAADLHRWDGLLRHFEIKAGLPVGTVALVPSLETAASVAHCESLARGPRVASLQSATARDGDISREVGFEWSRFGLETLYLRSKAVLACRANGLTHPLVGVWQDITDLDGLLDFSTQNRGLGFRGQLVLHPSHVAIVNDVYSVSQTELARARRMIDAFDAAVAEGSASVLFEGEHIDIAHIKTATALLDLGSRQEISQ